MKKENKQYLIIRNDYLLAKDKAGKCFFNEQIFEKNGENSEFNPDSFIKEKTEKFYNDFFKNHFKNIVILSAAGTSMDNGKNSGKSRVDLWDYCKAEIDTLITRIDDSEKLKAIVKAKDIEEFLSHVILFEKLKGELKNEKQKSLRRELESKIKDACDLTLHLEAPHINFLNKLSARKPSDSRLKLFTTNYDTLFEQAANTAGFVVVDGFSFTQPRTFSGRYFDLDIVHREKTRVKNEESFISKVFHLYKLHGSINWEKNGGKIFEKNKPDQPVIIFPATEKYESSYEQPYFEMMSRFQQALRQENVLLIVVGFGFQDKHIQNVIHEAIEQNSSFQVVIFDYNTSGEINTEKIPYISKSGDEVITIKRNVTVVFDSFGELTKKFPENKTYIQTTSENATL